VLFASEERTKFSSTHRPMNHLKPPFLSPYGYVVYLFWRCFSFHPEHVNGWVDWEDFLLRAIEKTSH
jgi:hypothetical protein